MSSIDQQSKDDVKILHEMGYAQELTRGMGKFQNFAISFSIICILSGGINSLAQATAGAGGAAIGIGWPIGCLISLVFGLAMAQISSAYPTAGGLYHWGSILGNRFTGWLTAWFNLIGLVTVLAAINVGTWTFFGGSIAGWFGINGDNTTPDGYRNFVIFMIAITVIQAAINHFGIKLTAMLTDFSGYLIFATALLLTITCLVFAQSHDFSRLWTFTNYSGTPKGGEIWPQSSNIWYIFALGLLLPIYTITGYDASAHTSEETQGAAENVPRGIVSSILWSSLFGWIMLAAFVIMIPATATIPDPADAAKTITVPGMQAAAQQGWNVFFWGINATHPAWLANLLYVLIFLSQFLCGLATVTSASRMIYAFSRDGGLPLSSVFRGVSPTFRTPVAAIWLAAALSIIFSAFTQVYTTVVSVTVIFLFLSFAVPIGLGLMAYGGSKWPKMGPWSLGQALFSLCAILSVLGAILIFVIGIQPPNQNALWITIGFIAMLGIFWFSMEKMAPIAWIGVVVAILGTYWVAAGLAFTGGKAFLGLDQPGAIFVGVIAVLLVALTALITGRSFAGPPIGDAIKKRQAEIAAAEAALAKG